MWCPKVPRWGTKGIPSSAETPQPASEFHPGEAQVGPALKFATFVQAARSGRDGQRSVLEG
jgi:hypothetical protein